MGKMLMEEMQTVNGPDHDRVHCAQNIRWFPAEKLE